jgi:dihydrofolate reductase
VGVIRAIAAVDSDWGIGYKGALLARIPEDQRFFKETTLGGVVIMGRVTFESLPHMKPLTGRKNIVLTKTVGGISGDVTVCGSLQELFTELKKYDSARCFVIGGESVYTQLLPFCEEAVITRFHKNFESDRHFYKLDSAPGWRLKTAEELRNHDGLEYGRETYENISVKIFTAGHDQQTINISAFK